MTTRVDSKRLTDLTAEVGLALDVNHKGPQKDPASLLILVFFVVRFLIPAN